MVDGDNDVDGGVVALGQNDRPDGDDHQTDLSAAGVDVDDDDGGDDVAEEY